MNTSSFYKINLDFPETVPLKRSSQQCDNQEPVIYKI